jgi:integrase
MASAWVRRRATRAGRPRYHVEYRVGKSGDPIRYAGSFKTMREAQLRKAWVLGEMAAMRAPDLSLLLVEQPAAPTVTEAAERWQGSRVDVAANTERQHATALARIPAAFRIRHIDTLTPQDVADLVGELHAAGKKRETIRKTLSVLAMILDHAGVTPNPARDRIVVKLPREEPEEPNPPTAEHVTAVYHLLPKRHRLALLWLDWSGMRVSSIDHTLISDYDEPRRRVRLRAAVTKTRRALWVELPPVLADTIEASIGPREDRDPQARLFASSGSDALRTSIAKACKAAGVPGFSPHDLRHRRISLLHLSGVPWARIGEQVGQRDLAVTANTYTHVMLDEAEVSYADLLN